MWSKHHVTPQDVEEVVRPSSHFRFLELGDVDGEDLYVAMGRTDAGRYLVVFFVHKSNKDVLVISARDMDDSERRLYERQKKRR